MPLSRTLGYNEDAAAGSSSSIGGGTPNINDVNAASAETLNAAGEFWRHDGTQVIRDPTLRLRDNSLQAIDNRLDLVSNRINHKPNSATANDPSIFNISSNRSTQLQLLSDSDNNIESDNPSIFMQQDGTSIQAIMGTTGDAPTGFANHLQLAQGGTFATGIIMGSGLTFATGTDGLRVVSNYPASYPSFQIDTDNHLNILQGATFDNGPDDNLYNTNLLRYYQNTDFAIPWTTADGLFTSEDQSFQVSRIGATVTISLRINFASASLTGNVYIYNNNGLPDYAIPSEQRTHLCYREESASSRTVALLAVGATGRMEIYAEYGAQTGFASSVCQVWASFSYNV